MVRLALKKLLSMWNLETFFNTLKEAGINTSDKLLSASYITIYDILSEETEEERDELFLKIAEYKKENVRHNEQYRNLHKHI